MIDSAFEPAPPTRAPKGYGGIYITGNFDPFFDSDINPGQRITDLVGELAEHPATRPHLEHWGLCYRSHPRGILLGCTRCTESPCICGDIGERGNHYMVEVFRDPILHPLFEQRRLAVRGG